MRCLTNTSGMLVNVGFTADDGSHIEYTLT